MFIAEPGDEESQGGCLAAGRGFLHISASGDVEPCAFAPYLDASLPKIPLREALGSPFLKAMRENQAMFARISGGFTVWRNREAVESLLARGPKRGSAVMRTLDLKLA